MQAPSTPNMIALMAATPKSFSQFCHVIENIRHVLV